MKNTKKNWTILIYANGNNELEPEMYQTMTQAEKIGSSEEINVVMQLGRAPRELARILRPRESIPNCYHHWTGVRPPNRYFNFRYMLYEFSRSDV